MESELKKINYQIGKRNDELINESDLILAILDGNDLDSGTCAEIGYAYGIGKKIIGEPSNQLIVLRLILCISKMNWKDFTLNHLYL